MQAFVIRKQAYSETDTIVRFLGEDGHLYSGFAPGGQNSRRRFPHQFTSLGLYEVEWSRTPSGPGALTRIQSCELIARYEALETSMQGWARWALVLEWIALEGVPHVSFEFLKEMVEGLCRRDLSSYFAFWIREVEAHGLTPSDLNSCFVCRRDLEAEHEMGFSFSDAAWAHEGCARADVKLSGFTRQWMQQAWGGLGASRLSVSEKFLDELDTLFVPYLMTHLDRSLQSWKFFEQVRN